MRVSRSEELAKVGIAVTSLMLLLGIVAYCLAACAGVAC